jgi:alanyl-tRNA synthetase
VAKAAALAARAEALGAIPAGSARAGEPFALLVECLDGVEGAGLQAAAQGLVDQLGKGAAVIATGPKAGAFIGTVAKACGGGGGRRPNLAQAGGKDGAALDGALAGAKEQLRQQLGVALG